MSDKSKIEWTDASWNPVTGCDKVSPGCKNCYAETFAERFRGIPGHPYEQGFDLKLWPERLDIPKHWRKPRRVFVNSMSDLFHEDVPVDFIVRVFRTMLFATKHTYQILTKRPERMVEIMSRFKDTGEGLITLDGKKNALTVGFTHNNWPGWPMRHVWLGVSCEDQQRADERIPLLLQTPAAVRWVSLEPLLGPIDLSLALNLMHDGKEHVNWGQPVGLNWVVVGGESGPGARPMHPDWVRSLRDQCNVARVPFFFKQWGAHFPLTQYAKSWPGKNSEIFNRSGSVTEVSGGTGRWLTVGKKKAGRLLDGREWNEYPGTHA